MDGELVSGEVFHPGLMLAWEEGDCPDVAISLMGLGEYLPRRGILLMVAPGLHLIIEKRLIQVLCYMIMLDHLWEQCQEPTPTLRR